MMILMIVGVRLVVVGEATAMIDTKMIKTMVALQLNQGDMITMTTPKVETPMV